METPAIESVFSLHPRPWSVERYFDGTGPSTDNCGLGEPPEYAVKDANGTVIGEGYDHATALMVATWPALRVACQKAEIQFDYMIKLMAYNGAFYQNADSECQTRLEECRQALTQARAGGSGL